MVASSSAPAEPPGPAHFPSGSGDAVDPGGEPLDQLDYEQARDQLVEVVKALEVGGLSLDESLALWERGERLARRCEQQLAGARDRVDAVLGIDQSDAAAATDTPPG